MLILAFVLFQAGIWPAALAVLASLFGGSLGIRAGNSGCLSGPALWMTMLATFLALVLGGATASWFWPATLLLAAVLPAAAGTDRRWLWWLALLALVVGFRGTWLRDALKPIEDVVERIRGQSGRVDGVAVRVSLAWDSIDDLDLIVVSPQGHRVSWVSPRSPDGGELDVDMNVVAETASSRPVENIVWPSKPSEPGTYEVAVMTYTQRTAPQRTVPITVEIALDGEEVRRYTGLAATAGEQGVARPAIVVATFEIAPQDAVVTPAPDAGERPDPPSEAPAGAGGPSSLADPNVERTGDP
jgi:hypothetical protein